MDTNRNTYTNDLRAIVETNSDIVFFGGAGVSTESGIPDFRSKDGLYSTQYDYPPEEILSHSFFVQNPEVFYTFYKDRVVHTEAKPNAAHYALAQLESRGKLKAVVTQNIDGLHQEAGSQKVIELHGSIMRNYCTTCGLTYPLDVMIQSESVIPRCTCGSIIRPDVVLYEEPLDQETMGEAIQAISKANTLIVGGTSLVVYPAAGLLSYFNGENLIVINRDPLPADRAATLVINESIGKVLEAAVLEGK